MPEERLRRAIRIGVTGHMALPRGADTALREQVGRILDAAREVVLVPEPVLGFEGSETARCILVSSLAPGADQLAAEVALAKGWELQCPLPFAKDDFRSDYGPEFAARFDALIEQATAVLELDGGRDTPEEKNRAYEAVGRVIVEHADVLLAIWDGAPAAGQGGTGQVVEEALGAGLRVVHLDPAHPGRAVLKSCPPDTPPCEESADGLARHVAAMLFPHAAGSGAGGAADPRGGVGAEAAEHAAFLAERETSWKRLARRLGLALAPWREPEERPLPVPPSPLAGQDALPSLRAAVRRHYEYADTWAVYYASLYRRLFQFNYVLGASAVAFALLSLYESLNPAVVWAEFVSLGFIATVYVVARSRGWHARAASYRTLAEHLRQMLYLIPLGLRPPLTSPSAERGPSADAGTSWIHWHLQAVLREIGMPAIRFDRAHLDACRRMMMDEWVEPQRRYHGTRQRTAHRAAEVLEGLGYVAFAAAAIGCLLHLLHVDFGVDHLPILLAAGAPAWGAAFHGIKSQGEYERLHEQHAHMTRRLSRTVADLSAWSPQPKGPASRGLRLIALNASQDMISELNSWRVLYRPRLMPMV